MARRTTVPSKSKTTDSKKPASKARPTKMKPSSLLKILPESVEHIEIVQQVAGVLEELQRRVTDVKEEARKELKKLMKRYETNYKGLEKKVHNVTSEAKKQAQTSMIHILQKWHEHKEKLPKPLTKELEKIIDQIGAKMVAKASAHKRPAKSSLGAIKKPTEKIKAKVSRKKPPLSTVKQPSKSKIPDITPSEPKL